MVHIPAQICGVDVCLAGSTDDQGKVSLAATTTIDRPKFKVGDGLTYARLAFAIPEGTESVALSVVVPELHDSGLTLVPGAQLVVDGLTLTIAPSTRVEIDTLLYTSPALRTLRVAAVSPDRIADVVGAALGLGILYLTAPIDTTFCPPARVSVPNSAGWLAGAAVEFLVQGVDIGETYAPYGGWAKVSDGVVSDDGETVSTSDGGGLPVLGAFGARLAGAP